MPHNYSYIFKIKPTGCTNISNLIGNKTLHVSDSYSVHHQEFFLLYTQQNLYDIYHCYVYSENFLMMNRGTVRNMQSFISKNKFEKRVYLVGCIIRIYHDALSPKHQSIHMCRQHHVFLPLGSFVKKYTGNRKISTSCKRVGGIFQAYIHQRYFVMLC